jgi:predicted RNase H-like HicB family nuclease
MFKYLVIIEKADGNFSAYSPDLPGCVATGTTIKETLSRMKDAIQFHIEGLNREGLAIPEPSAKIKYVEISI